MRVDGAEEREQGEGGLAQRESLLCRGNGPGKGLLEGVMHERQFYPCLSSWIP